MQPTKPASINARKKGELPESGATGATGATAGACGRPWRCFTNWTKSSTSARKLGGSVAISLSIISMCSSRIPSIFPPFSSCSSQYGANGSRDVFVGDWHFHESAICDQARDATKGELKKITSKSIATYAHQTRARTTFGSNLLRFTLKNALTLRTFASAEKSRCDRAR